MQIESGPIPLHVGIIPNGNRRWAQETGLPILEGHVYGYEKLKDVLKWLWELKVPYVTVFAMSTENCLYRSRVEVENLFNIIRKGLVELLNSNEIHKNRVRVSVIGRLEYVPSDIKDLIRKLEESTASYDNYFLTIALCYGGRQEIVDAVRSIAHDIASGLLRTDEINEEVFSKYLYTRNIPDVDLIIRTSGEERISNFLLWQSAYSELYFCDVYWPEFRKIDLWRAVRSYQKRERRFGR
ncbi:MAG: di-trans,poly-cis-decaprenylcistransferase [Desulfurococcaceae archaeon]|jgi:tritrans,polycis-undecaprenyl-diphosphate synthase [geranylgeranyl-diphosphate specific]|nr:di-trans,poly-cis-decaprenylcistransferase [Desulfurococcaceae archaeon]